jgi:hypothetical protein
MLRQVFWLSDHPTGLHLPSLSASGILQLSSPITAAGPSPILTEFPLALYEHLNGFRESERGEKVK